MSGFDRQQTALDDRRQRALEAYFDDDNVASAIETATRVRIDDEIMHAALASVYAGPAAFGRYHTAVKAAFKAAGFEVEQ